MMPIYGYVCNSCGKSFDLMLAITESNPPRKPVCPHCGKDNTQREWNAPAVVFKGDGFYTTDVKKENKDD
jgi:putative FmdB family regulatory protein